MIRTFVLRGITSDLEVGRKAYMSLPQAMNGFAKAAREHLGEYPQFIKTSQLFGGYYRNARGDVLEMR